MLYRIMIAALNRLFYDVDAITLEPIVRTALEQGEIAEPTEIQIQRWVLTDRLSERDLMLFRLLQDAIQDGCIRRVSCSEYRS